MNTQNKTEEDIMVQRRGKEEPGTEQLPPFPEIDSEECKGCGRCVRACPRGCLKLGEAVNSRGYRFVVYQGADCTGCAMCYYACPEPHALRIHRKQSSKAKGTTT
jgi:2-oxoisovalerate ferredoxin oxidoreductase delta subunit